jgi:hypothetical protein
MHKFPNELLAALALIVVIGAIAAGCFVIYTRAD